MCWRMGTIQGSLHPAAEWREEMGLSLEVSQAKDGEPPALDPPLWTADLSWTGLLTSTLPWKELEGKLFWHLLQL